MIGRQRLLTRAVHLGAEVLAVRCASRILALAACALRAVVLVGRSHSRHAIAAARGGLRAKFLLDVEFFNANLGALIAVCGRCRVVLIAGLLSRYRLRENQGNKEKECSKA